MTTFIITAYFKIPSKQSHDWYIPYLLNFVKNVRTNVIFFTTRDIVDELNVACPTLSHIKFIISSVEEFVAFERFGVAFWDRQYSRDSERYHSPQLGAIWYEKKQFVLKAIKVVEKEMSSSTDNIYIWCDAGCVRDGVSSLTLQSFGNRNKNLNDNKLHLQQVGFIQKNKFYFYPTVMVACAIMGGNKEAWIEYDTLYDRVLIEYDINEVCGTSDQNITISCVDINPNLFKLYKDTTVVNEWFKFLEIL